jgi:hypothetical protein
MIATELREGMKVQTADGPLTVKSSKPGPKGLQRVAFTQAVCLCRPDTDFPLLRDMTIYGRALRLSERAGREWRRGRMTREQYRARQSTISRAHYRAQHKVGALDYGKEL